MADDGGPDPDRCSVHPDRIHGEPRTASERTRRERYLDELLDVLQLEADGHHADPQLSHEHGSWAAWQDATGELPPDFARMPAVGALPDPLRREADGEWATIDDEATWTRHRERLATQLQYWIYGTMPPSPGEVRAEELDSRSRGNTTATDVRLTFGPEEALSLGVELIVPGGDGPFPVFVTQWNHRKWAEAAVERGYMAAVYAGADKRDDTTGYDAAYPDHSFQVLARRAWGASRVVDYLLDHPAADDDRIGITGHSRNGKQSLLAAAFDDRIDAVVVSSAGSGAVVPGRLDRDDFHAGDMSYHARLRRSWFHPRWRFFVGRENYLPVDANTLVSLVAPRACLLFTATNELTGNSFGIDRTYASASSVYELLGAPDRLGIQYRPGDHGTATRDLETIVDFFDAAFGRGDADVPVDRYHAFDRDAWAADPVNAVDLDEFPPRRLDDILVTDDGEAIETDAAWTDHAGSVRDRIRWSLGTAPPAIPDPPGVDAVSPGYGRTDHVDRLIGRPEPSATVGKRWLSPYHTPGKPFGGDLYYPRDDEDAEPEGPLPAVVWLHPFAYNGGYGNPIRRQVPVPEATDRGLCLFTYDQLGFGTRLPEGRDFYDRYPRWSKMGKLVADVRAAVRTLRSVEFVDPERICVLGYSLGATAGLYAAALDETVPSVAAVCGVPPLRAADADTEQASATIRRLSHHHGLQPRLGAFLDAPARIPFDFHEVMGLVAPRPQLVVAPSRDWTHPFEAVADRIDRADQVYELFGATDEFTADTPEDILSFDYHEARLVGAIERSGDDPPIGTPRRDRVFDWIAETLD